jgi:hypothetical protein
MVGFGTQLKLLATVLLVLIGLQFSHVAIADENQVTWSELSEQQQTVLMPLSKEWDTLRPWQRAKMLDIAKDYPKMGAKKQARVQKRLSNWSRMTPYEREQARKYHQQFKALPDERKAALRKKWKEYRQLSEADREKLRLESPDTYQHVDVD